MQMNIYVTDPRYRFNSVSITLYYMQMNIYVTDPRYRFNQI